MVLRLAFVALLIAMASSFGPPQAACAAAGVAKWWDSAWRYRTVVYRPAPYRPPQDGSEGRPRAVEVAVDFPLLLAKAGEPGEFDPASLRVVQRLPAGRARALPCALRSEYDPATRSQRSYVAWMAPPPADSSDAYDIYFDTKGGEGAKRSAPRAADLPPDNLVANPGFDEVTDGLPTGWAVNSKPLVGLGRYAHTVGQRSLKVTVDVDTRADSERQVELSQVVDVRHYAGQEMVFECDLMAERAKYGAPVAIHLEQYRADGSRIPEYAIYPRLLSIELAEGQLVQFRERGRFDPHAAIVKVRLLFRCSVEDEDTGQALTGPESFLTVWLDRIVMRPAERWPWPGLTYAGFVEGAMEGASVNRAFLFTGKRRLAFNGETDAFFNGGVFGDPKAVHWGLQAGTLELWLKPSWDAADGREHVLFYGIAYMHRLQSRLRKLDGESGNALEFTIADADGGLHTVRGIAPLRAGQWSHLAATWDFARAQLQLFVDGRTIGQDGPGGQPWPSSLTGKDGTKGIGATDGDSRSIPMQAFIGGDSEWGDRLSAEAAIDEFRISDTSRYEGSFTPSRREFTTMGRRVDAPAVDEHTRALFHLDNERNGTHDSDDEFIAGYLGCELEPQEETARLEVLRDGQVVSLAALVKPHGTAEQFARNRAENRMKVTRPFEALPDPRFVEYRTRTVEHTVGGADEGFSLDVGGDYQPLMRSITYEFADPGGARTSLIPHWWANDNVLPFSVDTLKATLGRKGRADHERAFQAFNYTLDTTNYYDADYCETLPDGRHRDRIDYTLIKALNIYPFDQCGPLNTMLRKTFLAVGISSADSPSTHHQIEQGFYDGQWRIFDLSSRLYWLDRDNETVIARRTIEDDPYLKYRQDGNPDAWLPGPAFEPPIGEAVRPHNMDFHLRPGERAALNWHNEGCWIELTGRRAPLPLTKIPPYFGNGAIIFEPVTGSDAVTPEDVALHAAAAGTTLRASRSDKPASLIYRAQCPYLFSDATITGQYSSAEPGAVTLALSFDQGKTWTEVWRSPDMSGSFTVNPRSQVSSRYAYWLKVGLAAGRDAVVTGLRVRSTFVASPLALPGKLSLGANRVRFHGTPTAPIKTTCTWVERKRSDLGVGLNTISYYLNSGEALRDLVVAAPGKTAPLHVALLGRLPEGDVSVEGLPTGWLDGPRRQEVKPAGDKQAAASFGLRPEGAAEGEVRGFEVVVRDGGGERRAPAQVLVASAPLVREAEQADATSGAVAAAALPEASGGRVATFVGDGQLTYSFTSPEGRYALWIRARWDEREGAGLTLTLDDAKPRSVRPEPMIGFTDEWADANTAYTKMFAHFREDYRHWSWYRIPAVDLKAGGHRLTLGARAGAQLDALMLLPQTDALDRAAMNLFLNWNYAPWENPM